MKVPTGCRGGPWRIAADDVLALIERLGADRVYNVGGSGGGPHALAFAAFYPDRVRATAAIASTAPPDAENLDWAKGMCKANRVELDELRRGDEALGEHIAQGAQRILAGEEDPFDGALCEADRAIMVGAKGEFFAEASRWAVRDGIWGWYDDQKALWGMDWGFGLDLVAGQLAIWQGDQDRMVPAGHSRWLARQLPGAETHFLPDMGHPSLYEHYYPAVIASLIGATQASRLRFPAL
jgi:pimeloyl-ACP methyl ester carboxylesterase